jgi:hypothetical protein
VLRPGRAGGLSRARVTVRYSDSDAIRIVSSDEGVVNKAKDAAEALRDPGAPGN